MKNTINNALLTVVFLSIWVTVIVLAVEAI